MAESGAVAELSPKTAGESGSLPTASQSSAAQPHYTAEYLAQLLKDKKQLAAFPNVFLHLERLVDEEVSRVRVSLFQFEFNKAGLELPENDGSAVQTIQEKVYVPVQDHPDYNFVGRILGPRGMTAKQLEQETGCKIMVRGKGSMRDKKKEEANRGKPNWEHLSDNLHVLIQCEDTAARCQVKLARAVQEIKKLLVPAPEGEDELKRKQLMELAIINGTYRAGPQTGGAKLPANAALRGLGAAASPLRSPTLAGAPIILSPNRSTATALPQAAAAAANPATAAAIFQQQAALQGLVPGALGGGLPAAGGDLGQGLLLGGGLTPDQLALLTQHQTALYAQPNPYAAQLSTALGSPLLGTSTAAELAAQQQMDASLAGAMLQQRRLLGGQSREHPYQRPASNLKTPTS